MKIKDLRKDPSWPPVGQVLERAIPLIPREYIAGIRRIVITERGDGPNDTALARYKWTTNPVAGDIEIYTHHYQAVPKAIVNNELYLTVSVLQALFHELYHHWIRNKRRRRPVKQLEENRAESWAWQNAALIAARMLGRPAAGFREEWDKIAKALQEIRVKRGAV